MSNITQEYQSTQFINQVRNRYFHADDLRVHLNNLAKDFSGDKPEGTGEFKGFVTSEIGKAADIMANVVNLLDKALDVKSYDELKELIEEYEKH